MNEFCVENVRPSFSKYFHHLFYLLYQKYVIHLFIWDKKENLNIWRLIGRIPPFVSQISDTPVSKSAGSKCYLMTAVCSSHIFFICYAML